MPHTQPLRVRVGVFQVDLSAGELRAINGGGSAAIIVLPQQPLQVLSMLLDRPGQLVSREAIQKQLWPNDTVVEFEHSINVAIGKLRRAFGDSANEPSYIETIAKRGYRLIAPTEWLTDSSGPSPTIIAPSDNGAAARSPAGGLIGKKVSHYRVAKVIGVGGMGLVYEAEDLKLGRLVALKFLPEDLACEPAALQRFEREARAASSLDHPNICTIYEVEEHEGEPFIVMQLMRGETLRDRLAALHAAQQRFSISELLDIALQVCEGLIAAHAHGVIHRDIKPANIFLSTNGPVKILDFGVAKFMEAGEVPEKAMAASASPDSASSHDGYVTETGSTMGTAGYMSPEQVRGEKLDARTDLFSFGLVLYEMATGTRAFSGETAAAVKDAIQNSDPVPVHECSPTLPPKLESIVNRALEKDREKRYQSATEMRSDLLSLVEESKPSGNEQSSRSSRWKLVAVAALICLTAFVAGLFYRRTHMPSKLTDRDTIVIADFDNKTGDSIFDDTLKQALSAQLSQSPFVNILPNRKVRAALKEMNRSANEPLTEDMARGVCRRTDSKAVLAGSIWAWGGGYIIEFRAIDCTTGDILAEGRERAPDKSAVIPSLDEAGVTIRRKLGEPLSSVQKYATPSAEATTSSLEAWKAYSIGMKTEYKEGNTAALPFYKRAVEINPGFAKACLDLSRVYANLNQDQRAQQYARSAYELRDRADKRLQLHIDLNYYLNVTGDMDKAAHTLELWRQNYPRESAVFGNLAYVYTRIGRLEESLEASLETVRLDRNYSLAYFNLATAYLNLNRLDEAQEVFKEAQQHNVAAEGLLQYEYMLAFFKGDTSRMAQLVKSAVGKPGTEDLLLAAEADTEGWHGRLKNARNLTQQAMDSAQHNDAKETAANYQAAAALRETAAGNWQRARTDANAALTLAESSEINAMAALALARAGDAAGAEKVARKLDETYRFDTMVQRYWLPSIHAALALARNDPNRAVELLNGMGTLELGNITRSVQVFLCPVYLRGEAYLMLRDGRAAAAEFQKFLDHYGLAGNFPWGALARLGLARAYALEAQTDPAVGGKARTVYENFFTLWKDADPDIPIYKQAKAEYAKLK